jgi:quercetin dioxygenase-like cupin family protein
MTATVSIVRDGASEVLHVLGVDVHFLCRADDTHGAWSLMNTIIPKGGGPPPHTHPWDEAYYVTAGEVEFQIEGRLVRLGAGDFAHVKADTPHAFQGVSDAPAHMLILDAPAHAEAFFLEVDREVRGPADMAKVPGIGARHQLNFLPPPQ